MSWWQLNSWVDDFVDFVSWWLCWLHALIMWVDDCRLHELVTLLTLWVDNFIGFVSWRLCWLCELMILLTSWVDCFVNLWVDDFVDFISWWLYGLPGVITVLISWVDGCWLLELMTLLTSLGDDFIDLVSWWLHKSVTSGSGAWSFQDLNEIQNGLRQCLVFETGHVIECM